MTANPTPHRGLDGDGAAPEIRGRPPARLFAAGLALVLLGACSTPTDPHRLVGTFAFTADSAIEIKCAEAPTADIAPISGTVVAVTETASGLSLDLGCRCQLALALDGALSRAHQPCAIAMSLASTTYHVGATVESWALAPAAEELQALAVVAEGTATPTEIDGTSNGMCTFQLRGGLLPARPRAPCGDDATAVGVLKTSLCPFGAGTDAVRIAMMNDDVSGCGATSASDGSSPWVQPEAVKKLPPCRPTTAKPQPVVLDFCRVDGGLFKPFPSDGTVSGMYALLQLGDACPPGSVSVQKRIDNEDNRRNNESLGVLGRNIVSNVAPMSGGTFTHLYFCLFRPADDPQVATMTQFPDLGLNAGYAVFHDFEGLQPPWVLGKRWLRSDDESSMKNNQYVGDEPIVERLKLMVESREGAEAAADGTDTVFDLARVR